jgi:thioredoxin-related protein
MFLSVEAQEKVQLNWLTDFEVAKQQAKETQKPILIYFTGSDWCAPCKMLKNDFFYTDTFQEKSKQFVLLMVDFPRSNERISEAQRSHNKRLGRIYNPKSRFPNIVAINHKGEKIANIMSYNKKRGTKRHYRFLEKVLKNY